MARQISPCEKALFEIVREYNHRFYYESIFKIIDEGEYSIKAEKDKEEMIGRALVTFSNGQRIDYEIRYNRIVNLSEGYTLLVPGLVIG